MNISAPFIARPVATTLLTVGLVLAGFLAYLKLPVSPLPQVDFPTISITAQLPGASPDTVATSVAEPLERHLSQIADITEMTSQSALGQARITLQFGLDRAIDGAARDVEAAINGARADLPASLRSNPTYRKVNPADAPVLILALTSQTLTRAQLYDAASNVFEQRLSQVAGIGQVIIGGGALPAVRVELNPQAMFHYGIGLEDVRAALASANANSPKGAIEQGGRHLQLYTNDQASHAADYEPLVVAYRNGSAVRLTDIASVLDSVEDLRNTGLSNGQPAILVILFRQPGANIISTVDNVKRELPSLLAAMPADVNVTLASDRTTTIRASLHDTERTLLLAVALVTAVVFLFLRDWRATIIPAIAVPASIIGTFGAMYLLGYSLDNLSLMALTVATGFVVDDAIVVLENIKRHLDDGMPHVEAALRGAREVGFTVLSISLSLIAVFIPILLMGGIVGRLFREFALTLSLAILMSLAISLTTTPMLCALFLRRKQVGPAPARPGWLDRLSAFYARTLERALAHGPLVMLVFALTIGLNIVLFTVIPKGFFPEQDTGRLVGALTADQSISFQALQGKLARMMAIVQHDPAVDTVVGFAGGGGGGRAQTNSASVYVGLKPLSSGRDNAQIVIARLRRALNRVAGAQLFLSSVQDIRVGGRQSNANYQYTLQSDDIDTLYEWAPRLTAALQKDPRLADVNSDQQQKGLETDLVIDRDTAARLAVTPSQIDNTLYDAFGQRQVSTIYAALNQYHVVMEVDPRYWQSPDMLKQIYVSTSAAPLSGTQSTNLLGDTVSSQRTTTSSAGASSAAAVRAAATNAIAAVGGGGSSNGAAVSSAVEKMVPLAAFASYHAGNTALAVNHQGPFVATTISFNLPPGVSLSQAQAAILQASQSIGVPTAIQGSFAGTAKVFQQSLASEPVLIFAALAAVYVVLGVLYESLIHPITILSTLPSAGIGAVLALMVFNTEFSIIALIGVILLIGIVKKNGIMMVDFAIALERESGCGPREAIISASRLRLRPILMTTMAALLGAVPLALSFGDGGEIRRPLGISIVGGLIISQLLTLYTTPVLYLYMDNLRLWNERRRGGPAPATVAAE